MDLGPRIVRFLRVKNIADVGESGYPSQAKAISLRRTKKLSSCVNRILVRVDRAIGRVWIRNCGSIVMDGMGFGVMGASKGNHARRHGDVVFSVPSGGDIQNSCGDDVAESKPLFVAEIKSKESRSRERSEGCIIK